jgi:quinol monooxygenase YgiN
MSVKVILEVAAKPGSEAALKKLFADALGDTRKYDGCVRIDVLENQDKAGNLILVEEWATRPHYEKYLAWRTETGLVDKLGGFLAGPPSIRYFEQLDA